MKIRIRHLIFVFFFLFTINYIAQENSTTLYDSLSLKRVRINLARNPDNLVKQVRKRSVLRVEGFTGFPYNLSLPLTIKQSGEPDINLTADFASKPFEIPIYWAWRISYWKGNCSWELEAVHHKLFLKNNPLEVQDFSISHGLNLITINRGWQFSYFILRVGAGVVIAHPESIIRNKKSPENGGIFNWGYYLAGPAINIAAAKEFKIIKRLYAICELKLSSSFSHVPIYNGSADLFNIAVQINFGLGFSLIRF